MTKDSLVKVYQAQGIFTAEVIKAKLEANDIPALLKYESIGQIMGITVDGLGRVEVYVPSEYADEALDLVQEEDDEAVEPYESGDATNELTSRAPTTDDMTAEQQE